MPKIQFDAAFYFSALKLVIIDLMLSIISATDKSNELAEILCFCYLIVENLLTNEEVRPLLLIGTAEVKAAVFRLLSTAPFEVLLVLCFSGSWKEKKFKPYNFEALGVAPDCGHLHPLMKVRTQFRQIFLEMG